MDNMMEEILNSPNQELTVFVNLWCKCDDNSKIELYDMLKLFISGEIDELSTLSFLHQYYGFLSSKESEVSSKFHNLMLEWIQYFDEKYNDEEKYEILVKLLKGINSTVIGNETEFFHCSMTKKIWSFNCFRKLIKYYKKMSNGMEYEQNGLFCSLFIPKMLSEYFDNMVGSVESLINDDTIHEYLVSYIRDILSVNVAYTYEDIRMSENAKCSGLPFCIFIMKLLTSLMKYYSLTEITKQILEGDKYVVKSYEISDIPFYHKLYTAFMFSTQICHVSVIKAYTYFSEELNILRGKNILFRGVIYDPRNAEKHLKLKMDRVKSWLTGSRRTSENGVEHMFIQNVFYSYKKIYTKLYSDDFFNDILTYVDSVMILNSGSEEPFYSNINKNLLKFIPHIMAGLDKHLTNFHIRFDAARIFHKILPLEGFGLFGGIFNDLFQYISEVDFFKWTHPITAVEHQKKIVQNIVELLDYPDGIIEQSENVISGTLFNLIRKALEIFGYFTRLCENVGSAMNSSSELVTICGSMVDTIMMTLTFYKDIYSKNIIKNIYPEVEEKYVTLMEELIGSSTNINHPIYTILRQPRLAANITKMSYLSIYSHLNLQDKLITESFFRLRDLIIDKIAYSGLSESQRAFIIGKFDEHKPINYDYPQEFLDPITCIPIVHPVKIPNVNEIFDRTSIVSWLHETQQNPYTKEDLTIEMLDKYNSDPKIINEINEFIEKKSKWEKNHTILVNTSNLE